METDSSGPNRLSKSPLVSTPTMEATHESARALGFNLAWVQCLGSGSEKSGENRRRLNKPHNHTNFQLPRRTSQLMADAHGPIPHYVYSQLTRVMEVLCVTTVRQRSPSHLHPQRASQTPHCCPPGRSTTKGSREKTPFSKHVVSCSP